MWHRRDRAIRRRRDLRFCRLLLAGLLGLLATACSRPEPVPRGVPAPGDDESTGATVPVESMDFEVPPPPFKDPDIFPCSACHEDLETNPERRELEMMHEDIELQHDEEHRWCLDCHDTENRDRLRMANGELVSFEESYRLCGQCHGDKYRDWRAGVHGRRTGAWNGEKRYLLCVHCHDSHAPRFDPMPPLPPPARPGSIR